eukprot:TRINITY_DN7661_c0_g1_i2.p1 TRINITY_DN7661_c0_g1~~TRINITY_DN7661_c0_g1_i2.p1  ORF type:complete len:272 (+),score=65.88 TRINITY_DN7661_c0_g1_i2:291-1106(+)
MPSTIEQQAERNQRYDLAWHNLWGDAEGYKANFEVFRALHAPDARIEITFGNEEPKSGGIEVIEGFNSLFAKHHSSPRVLVSTHDRLAQETANVGYRADGRSWMGIGTYFIEFNDEGLVTSWECLLQDGSTHFRCLPGEPRTALVADYSARDQRYFNAYKKFNSDFEGLKALHSEDSQITLHFADVKLEGSFQETMSPFLPMTAKWQVHWTALVSTAKYMTATGAGFGQSEDGCLWNARVAVSFVFDDTGLVTKLKMWSHDNSALAQCAPK